MSRPRPSDVLRSTLAMLRQLGPYLRQERRLVSGSLAALFLGVGLKVLEPWPLKVVIDEVLGLAESRSDPVLGLEPVPLLTICALAIVVLAGLRAVAEYRSKVGFALAGNRVLTRVRTDLYRHLQRLSLGFHGSQRGGDVTIRLVSDVGLVREVAVTALLPLVGNVAVLLAMVLVMAWLDWRLTAIAALGFPLLWIRARSLNRRIHTVSREQRRREGELAATAAESMNAIGTVQALALENRFAEAFSSQATKDLKKGVQGKRLAANLERSVDLLIAGATAAVLWAGSRSVLTGTLTPGELLVFLAYLRRVFRPVRDVAKYSARLAKASAASERVFAILDETPDVSDAPSARPAHRFQGHIGFVDVTHAYEHDGAASVEPAGGPREAALDSVSFEVAARSTCAIVGASGAGKSTITSLVLRLFDPTRGHVEIDRRDLRAYTLDSLRSQVGVVLQESLLFSGTIEENIRMGRPDATFEDLVHAARLTGADAFVRDLPDGYRTRLGERGHRLSGGEKQRLALARAVIRDPSILVLDEPTTGLDPANRAIVADAIRNAGAARTVIVVTHDLELAAACDRVVALEGGRVVEIGTPDAVLHAGHPESGRSRAFAG